jgi:hypothetical protein
MRLSLSDSGRVRLLWILAGVLAVHTFGSALLVRDVLAIRYERDVSRMVFNDNVELLSDLRRGAGSARDSLGLVLASPEPARARPYVVVSIEDHRLWYRHADSVLFTAPVTTGSGKVLEATGSDSHWKFETPRGRLAIMSKETDPVWVAPDWYYVEQAQARGLGVVRLLRGQRLTTPDSGVLTVVGSDVVLIKDGRVAPVPTGEGREIVSHGNLIVPPFGTNQRKYPGVLGTHRLNLGDGYALHGTDRPDLIGRSVSHGCVRLKNEDIATLYELVEPGTAVFIY